MRSDVVTTAPAGTPAAHGVPGPVGRPYGSTSSALAGHRTLRAVHFTYVRFVLEGMPLRDAWERCLAFAGGKDDERHFARRLREICAQIRTGARAHGTERLARIAIDDLVRRRFVAPSRVAPDGGATASMEAAGSDRGAAPPGPPAAAPAIPTLDEWIESRCAEYGVDIDFQPYGDWLAEYEVEFGDELATAGQGAVGAKAIRDLHDQAKRQTLRVEASVELAAPPAARCRAVTRDQRSTSSRRAASRSTR